MNTCLSRALTLMAAAVLAAVGVVATSGPQAAATPAPWDWRIVEAPFVIGAGESGYWGATCPTGYRAITGGLATNASQSELLRVVRTQEGINDGGDRWEVGLENVSIHTASLKILVHCVNAAQVPPITFVHGTFGMTNGQAQSVVFCPADLVVLSGNAAWSNVNTRTLDHSGPTWSGTGWIASGRNSQADALLTVGAYCVNPADVPGFERVEREFFGPAQGGVAVTCPLGKRILNGGTQRHFQGSHTNFSRSSFPTPHAWHATLYSWEDGSGSAYVRAHCAASGTPTVAITSASPGPSGSITRSPTAEFTFSGYDPDGAAITFVCRLDSDGPEPCNARTSFTLPTNGSHDLWVWAKTEDGRWSLPATYGWVVDPVPPTVTVHQLKAVTLGASVTVNWTGTDQGTGVKHFEVRHRSAPYNGSFGDPVWRPPSTANSVTLPLALGSTLCVAVVAEDNAGNRVLSPEKCTTRPLDDRALTASSGWTRGTGSAYWNGTYTQTKLQGKTLKRTGARLNRVGIVATRCASCGKVAVYAGSTLVGRIDLHASSTKHRQVLMLPAVAPRTGTVTVKVLTRNKLVRIDGLVVIPPPPPDWAPRAISGRAEGSTR